MSRARHVAAVALAAVTAGTVAPVAPAGARAELDRTFFRDGTHKLAVQADRAQNILVTAGRIRVIGSSGVVAGLTPGGHADDGFGAGGVSAAPTTGDPEGAIHPLLADPRPGDPRGLIVGQPDELYGLHVERLRGDGTIDAHWGTGSARPLFYGAGFVYPAVNLVRDPVHPGRVFTAAIVSHPYGYCLAPACTLDLLVTRLGADGRVDPTFGQGGVTRVPLAPLTGGLAAPVLAVTPDGALTVLMTAGYAYEGRGTVQVVRVDGSGDAATPVATLPPLGGSSIFADDGHGFFVANEYSSRGGVTHIQADGTIDPAFAGVPVRGLSGVSAVRTTADGIVVAGTLRRGTANLPRLLRLDAAGRPDPRFGPGGLLTVRFRHVRIAQVLSAITEDADGRLVLGGSVGDLMTDIREDYGPTTLGVMRVRTRPPDLDLLRTRVTVDRRGVAVLRVRCTGHVCPAARIDVRRGDRVLGVAGLAGILPGRRQAVVVHLGPRAHRLAVRRAAVDVRILPLKDPARPQETDPVLRAARLSVAR